MTQAQLFEMLRSLLYERFHFQFHRVSKEVAGYKLLIGKGGHKLAIPSAGERASFGGNPGRVIARNSPLSNLQDHLANRLDAPVANATGLTGNFSFTLTYDQVLTGRTASSEIPEAPSLFTAIQEQLGLKLENTRVTVTSYIVDSIQRPSAN